MGSECRQPRFVMSPSPQTKSLVKFDPCGDGDSPHGGPASVARMSGATPWTSLAAAPAYHSAHAGYGFRHHVASPAYDPVVGRMDCRVRPGMTHLTLRRSAARPSLEGCPREYLGRILRGSLRSLLRMRTKKTPARSVIASQRSNPALNAKRPLDCFVAPLLAMTVFHDILGPASAWASGGSNRARGPYIKAS